MILAGNFLMEVLKLLVTSLQVLVSLAPLEAVVPVEAGSNPSA